MSSSRTTTTTTSALVLLSMASTSHAFTSNRPMALVRSHQERHSIPGRAPVDVFYLDEESSEEPTGKLATRQPLPESLEPYTLSQELMLADADVSDALAEELFELKEEHDEEVLRHEQQASVEPTLSEKDIPALPTLKDLRKFALPCFGLLLSGPLLSLVDTAFVGLASTNAMELAALGPATTLFDCLTWFLSFLNVATTNLYSSALAKGDQNEAEGVVRTGSRIGLGVGLAVMTTLITFCKPILSAYMGK